MAIETIDHSRAPLWDEYVMRAPDATFYHEYRWRSMLESVYKLKTRYLAEVDGDRITGILPLAEFKGLRGPRSLVSLPYSNYGGVVADSQPVADALVAAARNIMEKERFSLLELKQDTPCSDQSFVENLDYFALAMPLDPDPDVIWKKSLNTKARNQVRKAEKSGLTVEIGAHLWQEFLNVYRVNQRDLGTPTHATTWYRKLAETYADDMSVILIRKGDEAVAGGWSFHFKDTAVLQYAASKREHLRLCPNNLAYWAGIEHMCRKGVKLFDFARSRRDSGTFHFKQQFGAVPRQTHYQYLLNTASAAPDLNQDDAKIKLIVATWRKLPLGVANTIGPHLRRRLST
jgi:serine/alanine adding enzyme